MDQQNVIEGDFVSLPNYNMRK